MDRTMFFGPAEPPDQERYHWRHPQGYHHSRDPSMTTPMENNGPNHSDRFEGQLYGNAPFLLFGDTNASPYDNGNMPAYQQTHPGVSLQSPPPYHDNRWRAGFDTDAVVSSNQSFELVGADSTDRYLEEQRGMGARQEGNDVSVHQSDPSDQDTPYQQPYRLDHHDVSTAFHPQHQEPLSHEAIEPNQSWGTENHLDTHRSPTLTRTWGSPLPVPVSSSPRVAQPSRSSKRKRSKPSRKKSRHQIPLSSSFHFEPSAEELDEAPNGRAKSAVRTFYLRLRELAEYKRVHGDCAVPQKYPPNPKLGIWVNKIRMEHKLYMNGEKTVLTPRKLEALETVGFIWAKPKGEHSWNEKYAALKQYYQQYGHSTVPTKYPTNPPLGRWVSTQRSQYKAYMTGKKSPMTQEKIQKLEALDFIWDKMRDV